MTPREPGRGLPIIKLVPNLLTLAAVCAGMTAIRFGFDGEFDWAVRLIIVAALLDGLDGRVARLLRSESPIGAELDSLADFLNFGVAPAFILYAWCLNQIGGLGWIAALSVALCCLLRLARFNVGMRQGDDGGGGAYFTGVPSPAGGLMVLFPLVLSLLFEAPPLVPPPLIAAWAVFVGFLMISRMRTYAFKNATIAHGNVRYVLLGTVILVAMVLIYTWATLTVLTLAYGASLVMAWVALGRNDQKG